MENSRPLPDVLRVHSEVLRLAYNATLFLKSTVEGCGGLGSCPSNPLQEPG